MISTARRRYYRRALPVRTCVVMLGIILTAPLPHPVVVATQPEHSEPQIIHITDHLNNLAISRKALLDFAASTPQRSSRQTGTSAHEVGDTRTFKVYNHLSTKQNGRFVLDERDFTALSVEDEFVIWVETAEIENDHVRIEDVESLARSVSVRTPRLSIEPSAGILTNNERIFGVPADVDQDGAVNILLVDIRDEWEPGSKTGYVAGFVWPGDLTEAGNESDIVYIDTYPGLYRNGAHVATTAIETTFAHEYLHLIHLNYDANEHTFVDEGLAEWASVLNGYTPRNITYLRDGDEHNVSLFHWRSGADVVNDYQRAGLFTSYLAQRMGPEATGSVVRQKEGQSVLRGAAGYESALAASNLTLAEVLTDFHVTNLLNDRSVDESLRYSLDGRGDVGADPTFQYDASVPGVTSLRDFALNAGAVQYFEWTNVSHLVLNADINAGAVAGSLIPVQRGRVSARLIVEKADGSVTIRPVRFGREVTSVEDPAERVSFVLVHHAPDDYGVRLDLTASWGPTDVGRDDEELPTRLELEQNYPNPFNPQTIVRYTLMNAGPTRFTIYDGLGRLVEHVVYGHQTEGEHEIILDGSEWPSGTYLYTLQSGGQIISRKMTLLR